MHFFCPSPDDMPQRSTSGARNGRRVPDEWLALQLAHRLDAELLSVGHRIMVEVQNGVVILEGVVPTDDVRRLVHRVAWDTDGVTDVANRLLVRIPRLP